MSLKFIKIENCFHGTSFGTHVYEADDVDGMYFIDEAAARRSRRKLCGDPNCLCSGPIGQRTEDGDDFHISEGMLNGREGYYLYDRPITDS